MKLYFPFSHHSFACTSETKQGWRCPVAEHFSMAPKRFVAAMIGEIFGNNIQSWHGVKMKQVAEELRVGEIHRLLAFSDRSRQKKGVHHLSVGVKV